MVGIFEQERLVANPYKRTDGTWEFAATYDNGQTWSTVQQSYPYLRQHTTSYRSGGDYGSKDDLTPQDLLQQARDSFERPHDNGHEFRTDKTYANASHKDYTIRGYTPGELWRGPLVPAQALTDPYSNSTFDVGTYDVTKGVHALRQTVPTKSAANISQMLLELLVDLPKLPFKELGRSHDFKSFARNSGGEYLNQVFAWSPLVADVLKICKAIVRTNDILQQYVRDSGRHVRRSFDYPLVKGNIQSLVFENSGLTYPIFDRRTSWYKQPEDSKGTLLLHTEYTERYWFRGAWMYFADEGNTFASKMAQWAQLADKLLGIKLDLETLWEIAPWSWLSDWFVNIGDVIGVNNALANDNLVLLYGYLMREKHIVRRATLEGIKFSLATPGPIRHEIHRVSKERIRSTPYGFGVSASSLTEGQWSILGALGLTKSPKKFWWG